MYKRQRFNCATIEDLFAGIGSGDIRVETVVTKMRDEFHKVDAPSLPDITPERDDKTSNGIVVEDVYKRQAIIRLSSS